MRKVDFKVVMDTLGDCTESSIPDGTKLPVFKVMKLNQEDAVNISVGSEIMFVPTSVGGMFNLSNGMRVSVCRTGQVRVSGIEFERWESI